MKDVILSKIKVLNNGCWEFQGCKTKLGYGMLWDIYEKRTRRAHRLSYKYFIGDIPKGLLVCHQCDNPSCVNPEHLFVGTCQDNVNDKCKKGRHPFKGVKRGKDFSNKMKMVSKGRKLSKIALDNSLKIRKKTYKFINPNNKIIILNGLRAYCLENNLNPSAMYQVHLNNRKSHKGWRKYNG